MAAEEMTTKELHASNSAVQREAELVAIGALSVMLGVALVPIRLELAPGASVHVDGYHPGPPRFRSLSTSLRHPMREITEQPDRSRPPARAC